MLDDTVSIGEEQFSHGSLHTQESDSQAVHSQELPQRSLELTRHGQYMRKHLEALKVALKF